MRLGLIAGNGRFPFLVLDAARALGHEVTVIAVTEEAFPELSEAAAKTRAAIHWVSLGQLGTCIALLKNAGVTHAVMAGQVKHTKIFAGGIVPDATFLVALSKLPFRNTDGLIGAVANVLRDNGVELSRCGGEGEVHRLDCTSSDGDGLTCRTKPESCNSNDNRA